MNASARRHAGAALGLVISILLIGCAPTPIPTASSDSPTASPTRTEEGPRFIIECVGPDGSTIGPFTRLEEAWASTNYVRLDHCTASPASDRAVELAPEEQRIAETASADLPDEDPVDLYLQTLATCVRVAPASQQGLPTLPTSILRAALELCPEAPHAGLMQDELAARSAQ